MNYKMILYTLGKMLLFEAAFLLLPTATALIYSEKTALFAFLVSLLICLFVGALFGIRKPKDTSLRAKEGFIIVALSWIVLSIFGAIPFVLSGALPNYVDALFETVSGFTTTGASVIENVEAMPHAILIWRSFSNWIGGMGVLVFVMAFIKLSGGQNMHIMKAESPGPSASKLVPKVRSTALWLYAIYSILTVVHLVILMCGGLDIFSAVNLSLATAGTGGFGVLNDSFASYSPFIQTATAVFLVLYSINFGSYFLLLRGKLKDALTEEVKTFLLICAVSVTVISLNVRGLFDSFGEALRHSFFNFASIISTAGFMSADYDLWPTLAKTVLVLAMFVGACAGSTGGGMKISRILIMFKSMRQELSASLHPKQVKRLSIDGVAQSNTLVTSVFGYLVCFILVFVTSLLIISLDGADVTTTFTAVTATIGNIGPGLSKVGPPMNYAFFSPLSKIVLLFDMLAGRLEFLPILLLFSPKMWRKG